MFVRIATVSQYFTLIMRDYGFGTFDTVLLSIPYNVGVWCCLERRSRTDILLALGHHVANTTHLLRRVFRVDCSDGDIGADLDASDASVYECCGFRKYQQMGCMDDIDIIPISS